MEDMVLDYGAITIDNSVLKGEGYRFDEGLLKQMNQFAKSPVKSFKQMLYTMKQ